MAEAEGSSAHLILNPAAGRGAALLGRLTGAARERGIRVRVLEPGQDARLAAIEAVEDGADALGIAGGDGSVVAVAGVAVEHEVRKWEAMILRVGLTRTSSVLEDRARRDRQED